MDIHIKIKQLKDYQCRGKPLDKEEFKRCITEAIELGMEDYMQWYGMIVDKIEFGFTEELTEFDENDD